MVRMQGQVMAGERRPVYPAWIHWSGGDNGVTGDSNDTPRTGRGGSSSSSNKTVTQKSDLLPISDDHYRLLQYVALCFVH
ncbi:TPA: hypothetical protein F3L22_21420 [Aeromonas hydrophila]|nr:hypothetical protein [Aeromonas hydrophila]